MPRAFVVPVAVILLIAMLGLPSVATSELNPVKARLVVDQGPLRAGGLTRVGVLISAEPGWHIYWQYPGEIGLPTKVTFKLPQDYKIGELQWPVPTAFKAEGQPEGFGYANEVLLWSAITLPPDYVAGVEVPVSMVVKWLGCGEKACVPGTASEGGFLGGGTKVDSELFGRYTSKLPSRNDGVVTSERMVGRIEPGQAEPFRLALKWRDGNPGRIFWFPIPPQGMKISESKVVSAEEIEFKGEITAGVSKPASFRSVVSYLTPDGHTASVTLDSAIYLDSAGK